MKRVIIGFFSGPQLTASRAEARMCGGGQQINCIITRAMINAAGERFMTNAMGHAGNGKLP